MLLGKTTVVYLITKTMLMQTQRGEGPLKQEMRAALAAEKKLKTYYFITSKKP